MFWYDETTHGPIMIEITSGTGLALVVLDIPNEAG